MKGMFAFLMAAACAASTATAETAFEGQEVGSIALEVGKSTMVAVAFKELSANEGQNISVSNILSTANIENGDQVYVYKDGLYQGWEFEDGFWKDMNKVYVLTKDGLVEKEGASASATIQEQGSGFWLIRQSSTKTTVYIYGAAVVPSYTTAIAGKSNLMGNPLMEDAIPTFGNAAVGDKIGIRNPDGVSLAEYTFNGSSWGYWKAVPPAFPTFEAISSLAIPKGVGFWYNSTGSENVSVAWALRQ